MMGYVDEDAETAIQLAIGAASMCWENVAEAGVFDSNRASEIAEDLLTHLRQLRLVGM